MAAFRLPPITRHPNGLSGSPEFGAPSVGFMLGSGASVGVGVATGACVGNGVALGATIAAVGVTVLTGGGVDSAGVDTVGTGGLVSVPASIFLSSPGFL